MCIAARDGDNGDSTRKELSLIIESLHEAPIVVLPTQTPRHQVVRICGSFLNLYLHIRRSKAPPRPTASCYL